MGWGCRIGFKEFQFGNKQHRCLADTLTAKFCAGCLGYSVYANQVYSPEVRKDFLYSGWAMHLGVRSKSYGHPRMLAFSAALRPFGVMDSVESADGSIYLRVVHFCPP